MSTEKEYPIAEDLRYDYQFAQNCGEDRLVPGYLVVRMIERVSRAEGQLAEMLHLSPHDLAVFASKWPVTQAELERLERENAALKGHAAVAKTALACPTCGSNRRDIRGTIHTEYLTRECADGWHQSALKPQCSSPTE